jgi:hypothetical protein
MAKLAVDEDAAQKKVRNLTKKVSVVTRKSKVLG